jgi:hypothetical protein
MPDFLSAEKKTIPRRPVLRINLESGKLKLDEKTEEIMSPFNTRHNSQQLSRILKSPLLAWAATMAAAFFLSRAVVRHIRRFSFENRNVLITGGSRGLRLAMAGTSTISWCKAMSPYGLANLLHFRILPIPRPSLVML